MREVVERALLLTDIVDSTRLAEELGDERAFELWQAHDRAARELLAQHDGREIDRTDGLFVIFTRAADAAAFALGYHAALQALGLRARVGLHVGTVTLYRNAPADVARGAKPLEADGLAKPFTARLMSLAPGGRTLLSEAAHRRLLDDGSRPGPTRSRPWGHYRLKGIAEPAAVFELGAAADADEAAPPPDTEKAYRVVRRGELWQPVREVRHNLGAERDAFVGRAAELERLGERLAAGVRLLTVVGPGGTGKTRFVRHFGLAWLGDWPGGVYFCDLSESRSADGIVYATATALGIALGKDDASAQIGHAIAGRGRCLVILDNFEQVVEHAGATLDRWLDQTAEACFVVTSRERLHLAGEELFPLEALPLDSEAIDLFVARARAQSPDFALTPANRAAVAEVVRLLDGLPLAIELAAARTRVLSPAQLVERMRQRFALLAGARGVAARQATLRAAIDWSWDLLAPWEQSALAQCSVFEGGFSLDAADAVLDLAAWPDAPPALDVVQSLVDKSLLRRWQPLERARFEIDEPHFGMYISIHEYARQRLDALGGDLALQAKGRHAAWFAGFGADDAVEALSRSGGVRRRHQLALDLDNLVAACRHACRVGDGARASCCHAAIWQVLLLSGPYAFAVDLARQVLGLADLDDASKARTLLIAAIALRQAGRATEGRGWVEEALALARRSGMPRHEADALSAMAELQRRCGQLDDAMALAAQALAMHESAADRRSMGLDLTLQGLLQQERSRYPEARACHERALSIFRALGDRRSEGLAAGNLGIVLHLHGDMAGARQAYEQAIDIHREVGNRGEEGVALGNLGDLSCDEGQLEQGLDEQRRALAVHRDVGNRGFEARVLGSVAVTLHELGRFDEALLHYEQSLALHHAVDSAHFVGYLHGNLGLLHAAQGRSEPARRHYELALAQHRARDDRRGQGVVLGSLGALLAAEGQAEASRSALQAGEALLREIGDQLALAKLLCKRGLAELGFGANDAARAALFDAEAIADALGVLPESELRRETVRLRDALG